MRNEQGAPFVVLGMPRSRTAWLARFLSYQDWFCGHDQLRYMRGMGDVKAWLTQANTGTCETGGAPFWRLLQGMCPEARVVVVRRPVEEVMESLWKLGLRVDQGALRARLVGLDRKLEQASARLPGALSVSFAELANESACAAVFEHCLPHPHNPEWWKLVSGINLQINFPATVRYMQANSQAINVLVAQAKQAMLRGLSTGAQSLSSGALVLAEEPIETVLVDCAELFREHCVEVGEPPDNWKTKNIPLMRKLASLGCMVNLVARCNGKPVGYLMAFISPSLEAQNQTLAQAGMFYGSPGFPGLGLRLQREMVALLRLRGVHEYFSRAGVRGDGPRLEILSRRLGAEPFGQVFRLPLEQ